MTDPYPHLRHLDGKPVTLRPTHVVLDADGVSTVVDTETDPPATLCLPALHDDEEYDR